VAVIAIARSDRSNAFCFSLDAAHAAIHINYLNERRPSRDAANSLASTGSDLGDKAPLSTISCTIAQRYRDGVASQYAPHLALRPMARCLAAVRAAGLKGTCGRPWILLQILLRIAPRTPSAVSLKFSLPTAHGLLAAHGRRKREPSDTALKGDTFRELTSNEALRPPFAELSGVAVGSKDRWSTVADQSLRVADLLNWPTWSPSRQRKTSRSFGRLRVKVSAIRSTRIPRSLLIRSDTPAGSVVIGGDATNDMFTQGARINFVCIGL